MSKLCLIYNTAPRYREAIFRAIDAEYDCCWYFGRTKSDIKSMDVSVLKDATMVDNVFFFKKRLYWQKGVLKSVFSANIDAYFTLGETRCVTCWLLLFLVKLFHPSRKIYFWSHGWYGKESWIERRLKHIFFGLADGVFLYGNYARDLMIQNGFDPKKLFVIHNSLHYKEQLQLRNSMKPSSIYREHFQNNYPVIIFIGRLTAVKRLDLLIEALAELKVKSEHYNLIFVGDGVKRKDLEESVRAKGLAPNVWFYGACYDEAINAELVYHADLCVSPGNVGLTAMHAMVFGTPVITHNCFKYQMPEFEAIQPGITGDFFEYNDPHSLANTISHWFQPKQNKRDEVRKACFLEIDSEWTPEFQMDVIRKNLKFS